MDWRDTRDGIALARWAFGRALAQRGAWVLSAATVALLSEIGDRLVWAGKVIIAGFLVVFLYNLMTARAQRERRRREWRRQIDQHNAAAQGLFADSRRFEDTDDAFWKGR